jgi:hypothetical protein
MLLSCLSLLSFLTELQQTRFLIKAFAVIKTQDSQKALMAKNVGECYYNISGDVQALFQVPLSRLLLGQLLPSARFLTLFFAALRLERTGRNDSSKVDRLQSGQAKEPWLGAFF